MLLSSPFRLQLRDYKPRDDLRAPDSVERFENFSLCFREDRSSLCDYCLSFRFTVVSNHLSSLPFESICIFWVLEVWSFRKFNERPFELEEWQNLSKQAWKRRKSIRFCRFQSPVGSRAKGQVGWRQPTLVLKQIRLTAPKKIGIQSVLWTGARGFDSCRGHFFRRGSAFSSKLGCEFKTTKKFKL